MLTDNLVLVPLGALLIALAGLLLPVRWRSSAALLGAAVASIATTTFMLQQDPPVAEADVAGRPISDPVDGYVGSKACRACHPHEHDTWDDSFHQSMTQVATPETVLGDFNDVEIDVKGKHYRLFREGRRFWVELDDPVAPAGASANRVRRPITMTTGSHNMQAYWFESGYTRVLGQLPVQWLVAEQRWISRDASFVLPPDDQHSLQLSSWNFVCIKCHATQGRPLLDIEGGKVRDADTRVVDLGIACESCHGPGGEHVAANQNPLRRYQQRLSDEPDPTIVNPARLPPKQSTQVCGQCHAVWDYRFKEGDNQTQWYEHGFRYRPGDDAEQFRRPKFKGEGQFWSDGLIRTAGREYNALHGSACYEQGGMTCLSCHVMHPADSPDRTRAEWANDQMRRGDHDRSCRECHASMFDDVAAHTHHAAGSSGSKCVNCHMPHSTYGLMKGVRTHRIESPSVEVNLATGRPNACNLCHLDQPLAWSAEHLRQWYGMETRRLGDSDRRIAAGVRWALEGDAGLRALVAWGFGWESAQAVAGNDWTAPYLAELLDDPYPVVRVIAQRSLRTLPGYDGFQQVLDGDAAASAVAKAEALAKWSATAKPANGAAQPRLLLLPNGSIDEAEYQRLFKRRDRRKIRLIE